jgi:hypothetical protein
MLMRRSLAEVWAAAECAGEAGSFGHCGAHHWHPTHSADGARARRGATRRQGGNNSMLCTLVFESHTDFEA